MLVIALSIVLNSLNGQNHARFGVKKYLLKYKQCVARE